MIDDSPPGTELANGNVIGRRLKFEMKKRGFSSTELAKRSHVKTSFIYDVISGKSTNPSTIKLARVVDVLGISLTYLVDNGAVDSAYNSTENYVAIHRIAVESSDALIRIVSLPVEDGSQLFNKQWILGHLSTTPSELRIYTMQGDSMEPNLEPGDTLLINIAQNTPSTPGIFVIFDGIGLTVKRLEYVAKDRNARVKIISDNAQYSSYERSLAEISIIGRVIWFARAM